MSAKHADRSFAWVRLGDHAVVAPQAGPIAERLYTQLGPQADIV